MTHARLVAVFRRVLLLSAGVSASVQACGGNGETEGHPDASRDGETDAGLSDGRVASDATVDATRTDATRTPDADAAGPAFPTCDDASSGAPYFIDGASCYYYVDFSCAPGAPVPNDCVIPAAECLSLCPLDAAIFECRYPPESCAHGTLVAEAGEPITVACGTCAQGRRPAGLRRARHAGHASALGGYFARVAYLEAASIVAFRRLAADLDALGAPRHLVEAALRAGDDEGRHTRGARRLARRFGAEPCAVQVRPRRPRTLEAVARENAVEGCVRETFGALVALWQAEHARDPVVRRHMSRIAADETRHAALAWEIHDWAVGALDPRARARVSRARRRAVERLAGELVGSTPADLRARAGLPDGPRARAWHRAMSREIWHLTACSADAADSAPPASPR